MPYVLVQVAGSLTLDQKRKISDEICGTLERIADKPRARTYIVFEEVSRDNWSSGGEMLSDRDKKKASETVKT